MSMTSFMFACACGGVMRGAFSPPDARRERELLDLWKSVHTTPACAPTTPKKAARARSLGRHRPLDRA